MMRAALCCRSRAMRYARLGPGCVAGSASSTHGWPARDQTIRAEPAGRWVWPVRGRTGRHRVWWCTPVPRGLSRSRCRREFLGYRLVKPRSPLSWHSLLTPLSKDRLAAKMPLSNSGKEACYAPNKITNHHFTLGGGWRRVCGIRNDRRTRRRRPGLRARSSRNRRSMHRPRQQCEQRPCASRWQRRACDGRRRPVMGGGDSGMGGGGHGR